MKPKNHKKKPLTRGVELEYRKTIGFNRTPVQKRSEKPIIYGLPTALDDIYRGR